MDTSSSMIDETEQEKFKMVHMSKLTNLFSLDDHELGNTYGRKLQELQERCHFVELTKPALDRTLCPFCGCMYRPGNHSVRVKPRMKLTPKIKRLLKRENQCDSMGQFQSRMVTMYKDSTCNMVITCKSCNRKNIVTGQSKRTRDQDRSVLLTPVVEDTSSSKKKKKKKRKSTANLDISSSSLDSNTAYKHITSTPKAALFPPKLSSSSVKDSHGDSKSSTSSHSFLSPGGSGTSSSLSGSSSNKKNRKAFHSQLKVMLDKSKEAKVAPKNTLRDFLSSL